MRIGKVIGTVTCSRLHPALVGGRFKLVVPLSTERLATECWRGRNGSEMSSGAITAEPIVVYDEFGAGIGHLIAISEGAEAAVPFVPERKPIDAYDAAILDSVRLDPQVQ
jgi:Carbon dioxide concentrating mechanism/carboxysome shell protein